MYALALLTLGWRLKRLVIRLAAAYAMRSCQIVRVEFFSRPTVYRSANGGRKHKLGCTRGAQVSHTARTQSTTLYPRNGNCTPPTVCASRAAERLTFPPHAQSLYSVLCCIVVLAWNRSGSCACKAAQHQRAEFKVTRVAFCCRLIAFMLKNGPLNEFLLGPREPSESRAG